MIKKLKKADEQIPNGVKDLSIINLDVEELKYLKNIVVHKIISL